MSCGAGYYCRQESSVGAIVEKNDNPLAGPPISHTSPCPEGYYCPLGSSSPTKCPAGHYCIGTRLSTFSGICEAGYICLAGSNTPRPEFLKTANNANGYICPKGHYCEQGATSEKPCTAGTYLNRIGAKSSADCINCPAGWYCSSSAADAPTELCNEGYYCPEGSTTEAPPPYICPIGRKCPKGSAEPQLCEPEKYQNQAGKASCIDCAPGQYCYDGTKTTLCPAGNYCPGKNVLINCPPGTYRDRTGGTERADCLDCIAGLVCETAGTVSPSIPCAPGYFCKQGAKTRFPSSGKCPSGHYCPERSKEPIPCPPGHYCATEGLKEPTGRCQEGFYCETGAITSKHRQCPRGHYCPEGSGTKYPCPIGTYGPLRGAGSINDCIPCAMGKYCDVQGMGSVDIKPCQLGFYCPLSQIEGNPMSYGCPRGYSCPEGSVAPTPCPAGQWQPNIKEGDCLECPEGYYCDGVDGSQTIDCPRGYFCPPGTEFPSKHPCPKGTYGEKLNAKTSLECQSCPSGYYCQEKGQSVYADLCAYIFYLT